MKTILYLIILLIVYGMSQIPLNKFEQEKKFIEFHIWKKFIECLKKFNLVLINIE